MADDITVKILQEIRDAIVANGHRIDTTNQRIDATNERLDATNERLDVTNERLDATNERMGQLEGAMLEMAEQQRFLVRFAKAGRSRDHRLEVELATLRQRVDDIESRLED